MTKLFVPSALTILAVAFALELFVVAIGFRPGGEFWPRLTELLAPHSAPFLFIVIGVLASLASIMLLALWYGTLPEHISKWFPFRYPFLVLPTSARQRLLTETNGGAPDTMFPRSVLIFMTAAPVLLVAMNLNALLLSNDAQMRGLISTLNAIGSIGSAVLCVANTAYIILIRRCASSPEAKS